VSIFVKPGSALQSPQKAQRDADTADTARVFGELVKPGAPPARNAVEKDAAKGARSSSAQVDEAGEEQQHPAAATPPGAGLTIQPSTIAPLRAPEAIGAVSTGTPLSRGGLARALVELRAQPESPDVQQATAIVSRTLQLMDFVESRRLSEIRTPNRFGEGKPR
jgi:hypothetical protein